MEAAAIWIGQRPASRHHGVTAVLVAGRIGSEPTRLGKWCAHMVNESLSLACLPGRPVLGSRREGKVHGNHARMALAITEGGVRK
jgi:hypothetical protein